MKKSALMFVLLCVVCGMTNSSMSVHQVEKIETESEEVTRELTIYEIAEYETGCPAWILRGIRFAESSYGANIDHPDPLDIGDFGLHEDQAYHKERARKYGEYNPWCPLQSAIIAGHIIMENYHRLGGIDAAISAYRHGVRGTRIAGIDADYVGKVYAGGV